MPEAGTASHRGAPLRRAVLWGLLVAVVLAIAVAAAWSRRWGSATGAASPTVLGGVPDFRLVDQEGRAVTLADLRGTPWIAGLLFTRCGGQCPRLVSQMERLGRLVPHPELVRRVAVTVDPEYDTPEVLARYAAARGIADPRWLFLTGPPEEVRALARHGFKLGVEPASPEAPAAEPILHSTHLVLVDAAGQIRGYYDAFDEEAIGRLLDDLRALLREA